MARPSRSGRRYRRTHQHNHYARAPHFSVINVSIMFAKLVLLTSVVLLLWMTAYRLGYLPQLGSAENTPEDVSLNAESKSTAPTDNIPVASITTPTVVETVAKDPDTTDALADTPTEATEDVTAAAPALAEVLQNVPDNIPDAPSDTAEKTAQIVATQAAIAQNTIAEQTAETAVSNLELVDEQWIVQLNPEHFIVQYASTVDIEKLIEFIPVINNAEEIAVYPFKRTRSGQLVYGIATGVYPDLASALASLEELSAEARSYNPWVRPIRELIQQINTVSF